MTRLRPLLSDTQLRRLPSSAERRVYEACRAGIGDERMVIFSLPWIHVSPYGTPRDGETDFIVFDSARGILVIEVKGGGVRCDGSTGQWISVDRNGTEHEIKDPFRQAKVEKYALREYLAGEHRWRQAGVRPTLGHAVMFGDLDSVDRLAGPDRPRQIIGCRGDVGRLGSWLADVFDYWGGGSPDGVGAAGMSAVEHLLFRDIEVKPLLAAVIEDEELERIRLTAEQTGVLRMLGHRRRAVVSGGAGTGKTLLAVEKARSLADEGQRTLLVCYNRPLADHLARCCDGVSGLEAMGFHQLCDLMVARASEQSGIDLMADASSANPGMDRFDVHCPHALAMATELLEDRYDAIVVDEAQDFGQEYWFPIELLLADADESTLFLFYDHNQAVYSRVSTFPISDEPFLLTRNCRNTRFIHDAAYRYYSGEPTEPPPIDGGPIEVIDGPSRGSQAKRVHALVARLISEEQVPARDVAVLVPGRGHRDYYDLLRERPLPRPATWAFERYGLRDGVRVDTWNRFKGLEAGLLVVWGADELSPELDCEQLYVTLSRAKSRLYLVGRQAKCEALYRSVTGGC